MKWRSPKLSLGHHCPCGVGLCTVSYRAMHRDSSSVSSLWYTAQRIQLQNLDNETQQSNSVFTMKPLTSATLQASSILLKQAVVRPLPRTIYQKCPGCRQISKSSLRFKQAGDDPNFVSIADNPAVLVRTGRRHGPGLILLGTSSPYPFPSLRQSQHVLPC